MKDMFDYTKMLALSWRQPYASLMLHGKIETRTWNTNYRGMVLICASLKPYSEMDMIVISGEVQTQKILTTLRKKGIKEPTGMAIAIGNLVNCRKMHPSDEDRCFVQYRDNLYCHIYQNVISIEPFEWKGKQGWKTVPQDVVSKLPIKLLDK